MHLTVMKRFAPYVLALSLIPIAYSCKETPKPEKQYATETKINAGSNELLFLWEMEKMGYKFSDENFKIISLADLHRKPVKSVWLEPSQKDVDKRFPVWKGYRIRTGCLDMEPCEPLRLLNEEIRTEYFRMVPRGPLFLADDAVDETAISVAQRYRISFIIKFIP
jgi:hypothetical protein